VAFSEGLLPGASVSDGQIQPGEIDGGGTWSPANSDGTYGGIQPCSYGLIHSRNTMSVRVGQFAGLDAVQKVATTLNLSDNVPRGPAIYIGSFETNLKDLTAAYTVFPNAGVRKQAYLIERIDDAEHQPIYRASHIAALALPVWVQVTNKGATIYPPQDLQPTMPMQHALVCSLSNHLATTGCEAAGTAYEIDLPADKVPTAACEVHGGEQMQFAQKLNDFGKKAGELPNKLFQSFKKFFGGRP